MPRKKLSTNSSTADESINVPSEEGVSFSKMAKSHIFLSRVKRKFLKHVIFVRLFLLFGIGVVVVWIGVVTIRFIRDSQVGSFVRLAGNFIFAPEEEVDPISGRVNILLLGKGGDGHEAPDLTDSVMLLSLTNIDRGRPFGIGDKSKISIISMPRDIWITSLRAKLNSVYYWGNQKQSGGGLVLAKSTVEEITGQPIQYGIVIDFSGFKKIIDVLGGINVDVQNSFTDNDFPIAGREDDLCGGDPQYRCRYESISFNKGLQYMDGETALKFVRSRHALGEEGTDIARAARQERVIQAIKNKTLTRDVYTSPSKLISLKNAVLDSVETDITPDEAAVLLRWLFQGRNSIDSQVLSEDLLENPPKLPRYDNLYVFVPKELSNDDPTGRSWSMVQKWVECVLSDDCK